MAPGEDESDAPALGFQATCVEWRPLVGWGQCLWLYSWDPSPALDPFLTPTSGTWGLAFPDLALTFFFKPIPNDTGP